MGLEVSTYIAGMTASWPVSGDQKSQGDDHLRLLKTVLQSTFPSADRPFYFPKTEAVSGTITLDTTDQNNAVEVTTTAGNVTVNLPSTLGVGDKGWRCEVVKVSADANAAIVTPASGTIASKVGSTATIRVGILHEPAAFTWTGTAWRCSKPGPMIGSTENFDGAFIPWGYLNADGVAYNTTNFAELFAVLASGVVKDKRGRVEAGVDGGVGRLSATFFGASPVLGAVGGNEWTALTAAQMAIHNHNNTLTDPNHFHSLQAGQAAAASGGSFTTVRLDLNDGTVLTNPKATGMTITNANAGNGDGHRTVQPTVVVNKIIRAC